MVQYCPVLVYRTSIWDLKYTFSTFFFPPMMDKTQAQDFPVVGCLSAAVRCPKQHIGHAAKTVIPHSEKTHK